MFRVQAPILIVPTAEAREALGRSSSAGGARRLPRDRRRGERPGDRASPVQLRRADACRVLARPPGRHRRDRDRSRRSSLPTSSFTAAQMRQAEAAARARAEAPRRRPRGSCILIEGRGRHRPSLVPVPHRSGCWCDPLMHRINAQTATSNGGHKHRADAVRSGRDACSASPAIWRRPAPA